MEMDVAIARFWPDKVFNPPNWTAKEKLKASFLSKVGEEEVKRREILRNERRFRMRNEK